MKNQLAAQQGSFCKGRCIKLGRPIGNPYEKGYYFCSNCSTWCKEDSIIIKNGIRHTCCNRRVRTKKNGCGKK